MQRDKPSFVMNQKQVSIWRPILSNPMFDRYISVDLPEGN